MSTLTAEIAGVNPWNGISRLWAALSASRHAGLREERWIWGRSCRFNPITCCLISDLLLCTNKMWCALTFMDLHVCKLPMMQMSVCICEKKIFFESSFHKSFTHFPSIHPFIHFPYQIYTIQGHKGTRAYSSCYQVRGRVHHRLPVHHRVKKE